MKKKIIYIVVCLSLIAVFFLNCHFFINTDSKKNVSISSDLEVEVYSNTKVSDFVSIDEGSIVDDFSINTKQLGNKEVNYEYSFNDAIYKDSFIINVVDTTAPYIGISKSYTYIIGNDFNLEGSIFCGDNYTKRPECSIAGEYSLTEMGEYSLIYRAVDESGNVSESPFVLKVLDKRIPSSGSSKISFEKINDRKPDDASLMIDVSKWQGNIDWEKVKSSGIDYAMLRVGTQTGVGKGSIIDSYFEKNIINAQSAGVKVGVYYYSYARDESEALEQAEWVISILKDYELDLPVAFDWECWSLFNSFNINFYELNSLANTFLEKIKSAGYNTLLYGSKNYIENVWNLNYDIWLAHYTEETSYTGPRIMWQFTSIGEVPGINGNVDINFYYND